MKRSDNNVKAVEGKLEMFLFPNVGFLSVIMVYYIDISLSAFSFLNMFEVLNITLHVQYVRGLDKLVYVFIFLS